MHSGSAECLHASYANWIENEPSEGARKNVASEHQLNPIALELLRPFRALGPLYTVYDGSRPIALLCRPFRTLPMSRWTISTVSITPVSQQAQSLE